MIRVRIDQLNWWKVVQRSPEGGFELRRPSARANVSHLERILLIEWTLSEQTRLNIHNFFFNILFINQVSPNHRIECCCDEKSNQLKSWSGRSRALAAEGRGCSEQNWHLTIWSVATFFVFDLLKKTVLSFMGSVGQLGIDGKSIITMWAECHDSHPSPKTEGFSQLFPYKDIFKSIWYYCREMW